MVSSTLTADQQNSKSEMVTGGTIKVMGDLMKPHSKIMFNPELEAEDVVEGGQDAILIPNRPINKTRMQLPKIQMVVDQVLLYP